MVLLECVGTESDVLLPSDLFCSRSSFILLNFNLMSYASQHADSIKFSSMPFSSSSSCKSTAIRHVSIG